MRTAFIQELALQAEQHADIFLVAADLGFSVVEDFAAAFPQRYLNSGVAEQNTTGLAAGLAAEGWRVFTYSIANFPTLRCLEQIRNDICYHRLPVVVVAVGAGTAYGNLGYSHHAVQDIAIMRTLPDLTLLSPADPGEARACVQWLVRTRTPAYLRLGKAGEKTLHEQPLNDFEKAPVLVRPGRDLALVATGSILKVALEAADLLCAAGHDPAVYSCPWLCPTTPDFWVSLSPYRHVFTFEDHLPQGGLYSLLREQLPDPGKVRSFSIAPAALGLVGTQEFLREKSGLSPQAIVESIRMQLDS